MTTEGRIAVLFRLDEMGWARHANQWSGWTRFTTCLPLLVLLIWSRIWLDWWSLLPIALALVWIWYNPPAFEPARNDRPWITKGVLGERFWSSRHMLPVPHRHRMMPNMLNFAASTGVPFLCWGLFNSMFGLRSSAWP